MSTTYANRREPIIVSSLELQKHYCFRLHQVGFPPAVAMGLAGLMMRPPEQLTPLERNRAFQAIGVLENQKINVALKDGSRSKVRRSRSRSRTAQSNGTLDRAQTYVMGE